MSIQAVKDYLKQFGRDKDVMELAVSSATVPLAAEALGVTPARIAKTLSFADGEGALLLVAAGDARVDNARFKARFEKKAKMLTPDQALALTGHAVGGVCPFAIDNPQVRVYLDVSLKRFETVYPACGSSNSAIELTCRELEAYSKAEGWVDVCKSWREEGED